MEPSLELRDIEAILHSPWVRLIEAVLWTLGALLVLVIGAGLIRWLVKRLGGAREMTASERALQAIAALKRSGLIEKAAWQGFYFGLYPAFKHYASEGFGLDITQKTNVELKADLNIFAAVFPDASDKQRLATFLERSETIKFARDDATREQCEQDLAWFEAWVRRSGK